MDKQEVFDRVANHLFSQGEKAIGGNSCVYRAVDGKRCAVGCLIPDDRYHPALEGQTIRYGLVLNILLRDIGFPDASILLLQDLQDVHDGAMPFDWLESLKVVANLHALDRSILDGAELGKPLPGFASRYPEVKAQALTPA